MKPAQHGIGQARRHQRVLGDVFGKLGLVGTGEFQAALPAIVPRRPAERALGRDVDGIGRERLDLRREAVAGVGRASRISG